MISIRKNYDDIPLMLKSKEVQTAVSDILRRGGLEGFPRIDILMHQSILDKLSEVYHSKCAFCERKVDVSQSSAFVTHYRPAYQYPWLTYEWSNLILVCDECNLYKEQSFPLMNEGMRVLYASSDAFKWRANHKNLVEENPLIINPELDKPEMLIYFNTEGIACSYNQNIRAITTINAYRLNLGQAIVQRKALIRNYRTEFQELLEQNFIGHLHAKVDDAKIVNVFKASIDALLENAKPHSEFSLLAQNMLQNFNAFFVDTLENASYQYILQKAYQLLAHKKYKKISYLEKSEIEEITPEYAIRVQSIKFHNVKCFDEIIIEFPDLSSQNVMLITGLNGSGKSSLLQTLALALTGVARPPVAYGWTGVRKNGTENAKFSLGLSSFSDELVFDFYIDEFDVIHCINHKEYYESTRERMIVLGYGVGRNYGKQTGYKHKYFEPIASLFGEDRYLKTLDDDRTYDFLNQNFESIKKIINMLLEGSDDVESVFLNNYHGRTFYFYTPTGEAPLHSMSDGFQTMFSWIFDMLIRLVEKGKDISMPQDISAIILIDEIDRHLNIKWQRKFVPVIEKLFPNMQFFITTQSPFTIQSLSSNNVIMLELNEEHIVANPFFVQGKSWGWTISEIMAKMTGNAMEISDTMDAKLLEFAMAVRRKEMPRASFLYKEIKQSLTITSVYHQYLDVINEGFVKE